MRRKYRIRKDCFITGKETYTPQQRIFFKWFDLGWFTEMVAKLPRPVFSDLESCEEYIYDVMSCECVHKPMKPIIVEYFGVE